jgi:hypothetical protein
MSVKTARPPFVMLFDEQFELHIFKYVKQFEYELDHYILLQKDNDLYLFQIALHKGTPHLNPITSETAHQLQHPLSIVSDHPYTELNLHPFSPLKIVCLY